MIRRDQCVHGHDFDEANTRRSVGGTRACRVCDANRKRESRSPARVEARPTAYKTAVVDRIRALKYEPDPRLDWTAGDMARKEFEVATGELPRKGYRQKISDSGTHQVAIYPDWYIPRIDKIIEEIAAKLDAADAEQGSLFDGV